MLILDQANHHVANFRDTRYRQFQWKI